MTHMDCSFIGKPELFMKANMLKVVSSLLCKIHDAALVTYVKTSKEKQGLKIRSPAANYSPPQAHT